jgi:hypothetical protein
MIGGLFYDHDRAGTDRVPGATFGRFAGRTAAQPERNRRANASERVET